MSHTVCLYHISRHQRQFNAQNLSCQFNVEKWSEVWHAYPKYYVCIVCSQVSLVVCSVSEEFNPFHWVRVLQKKTAISSYVLALKHITPVPPISMLMVFGSIEACKKNSHFCLCVVVCSMSTLIWGVGGYDMGQ